MSALRHGSLEGQDLSLLTGNSLLRHRHGGFVQVETKEDGTRFISDPYWPTVWADFTYIGERGADGWLHAPEGGWSSNPVPGVNVTARYRHGCTTSSTVGTSEKVWWDSTVAFRLAHPAPEQVAEASGREGDEEEAYQIGKRDGYEEAVADIDRLTGGDGEYVFRSDGMGCDTVEKMKARIVDRIDIPSSQAERGHVMIRQSVLEHAIKWARKDRAFEPAAYLEEAVSRAVTTPSAQADRAEAQDAAVVGLLGLEALAKAMIEGREEFMKKPLPERREGRPDWWTAYRAFADAAGPEVVLSLIEQIRRAEAERDALREALTARAALDEAVGLLRRLSEADRELASAINFAEPTANGDALTGAEYESRAVRNEVESFLANLEPSQ